MRLKRFLLTGGVVLAMTALTACGGNNNSSNNGQTEVATDGESTADESGNATTADGDSDEQINDAKDEDKDDEKEVEKILEFSKDSGIYADAFELEIGSKEGGEIYYTTDGSNPSQSDTAIKYEGALSIKDRSGDANVLSAVDPLLYCANFNKVNHREETISITVKAPADANVDKCTVIKAACKKDNGEWSEVETKTYFIGAAQDHIQGIKESCEAAGKDLAVISISMDYDDLFDKEKGIYVKGDIFDAAFKEYLESSDQEEIRKLAANYNQRGREWEREAHVDFFEMNAEGSNLVLNQDCGIRVQGNYSRSDWQKSFRLYARKDYGKGKFKYPIWGDAAGDIFGNTIEEFKTFVVRAGGNCAFNAKYNDTYWQDVLKTLDCDTKASRPCVVYLNGEYWGLYILEEDYTDDYYKSHYGVDKKTVVSYKGDAEAIELGYKLDEGELPENVTDEGYYFNELFDFFKKHKDLKDEESYEEFSKLVDVESVRDYFAAQVWINNKWDWPGKNWLMWKTTETDETLEYADGRWRFAFFDLDFGGVSGKNEASANTIKDDNYKPLGLLDMDTENPAVLSFAYLMTNDNFRVDYCEKLLSLSDKELEKEHAKAVLTTYEETYGPLFDQFFKRYPGTGKKSDALTGGYSSSSCIKSFIQARPNYIQKMIDWVNKRLAPEEDEDF